MVSGDDRHVICLGTETTIGTTTTQDNMFIRWSDQETVNTWTPTATNTAGSQRLTAGNQINAAVRSRGAILIWTDTSLYQMQFIGPPFTFGFKQLGDNCGAVGIHTAIDVSGISYWMGHDSFFMFDGAVKKIPCTVQDYVFDDINPNAVGDIYCSTNSDFNEVIWFYAASGSLQINRHVTYNYAENLWHTGSLSRSTWADRGVYANPYATEFDSDDSTSISRFIPDFKNQTGTVDLTVKSRPYPATSQTTHGPYAITTSTTKQDTRIRGRQLALRVESDAVDEDWRYGTLRFDGKPDGLRGG